MCLKCRRIAGRQTLYIRLDRLEHWYKAFPARPSRKKGKPARSLVMIATLRLHWRDNVRHYRRSQSWIYASNDRRDHPTRKPIASSCCRSKSAAAATRQRATVGERGCRLAGKQHSWPLLPCELAGSRHAGNDRGSHCKHGPGHRFMQQGCGQGQTEEGLKQLQLPNTGNAALR